MKDTELFINTLELYVTAKIQEAAFRHVEDDYTADISKQNAQEAKDLLLQILNEEETK